jgi:hypothetical protein
MAFLKMHWELIDGADGRRVLCRRWSVVEGAGIAPALTSFEVERNQRTKGGVMSSLMRNIVNVFILLCLLNPFFSGQTAGKIRGVVADPTGAVLPGASVTLINAATGAKLTTSSDAQGVYNLPVLAVGQYAIEVTANGFQPFRGNGLKIDINSALTVDVTMQLATQSETVEVDANTAQVETTDTQIGQTIDSKQVAEIPLNGRSYTDLLAIQAGVAPITTSGSGNSSSGGGFGTLPDAGQANTGRFSIHGQRESDNAYYLNGASVQETIGQQAGIPNLDSIAEFRILSSNVDAEYGSFTGGIINVVTKSGTNQLHGSAFEFLRNTGLGTGEHQ